MEHKIELIFGYTDKDGNVHREVTIGKRPTVGDLLQIESDPRSASNTQHNDLVLRKAITSFGEVKTPVPLDILLALTSIDRDELRKGYRDFINRSRVEQVPDPPNGKSVTLLYGFRLPSSPDDVLLNVEFGKMTTGRDEVEADAVAEDGLKRECFLLGRRITRLSTQQGTVSVEGPITVEQFEGLDIEDFTLLRIGARIAESSFRSERTSVSAERHG
jgi:phage FluMu protein gp41